MKTGLATTGLTATFMAWSLANVFASIAMFGAMGIFYSSLTMSLTFYIYCKIKNYKFNFNEAKKVIPHAVTRVLGLCFLSASLLYVKVGVVDTIIACNVFIVVCILAPLQGEKFKPIILIPLSTSVIGVGFICLNGVSISAQDNGLKLLLPIGAMITLAFSIYLWRKCSVGIVPIKYMTYMHSWVAMFTIPTVLALRQINISNGSFTPSPRQIFFIALSLAAGTLGDFAFSYSQKFSSFSLNALIAPTSAIFSSVFAWLLASQSLNPSQIIGMCIVVTSIAISSRINSNVRVETTISQEFDDELLDEFVKINSEQITNSSNRDAPMKTPGIAAA